LEGRSFGKKIETKFRSPSDTMQEDTCRCLQLVSHHEKRRGKMTVVLLACQRSESKEFKKYAAALDVNKEAEFDADK
jgi:hypothetical protein